MLFYEKTTKCERNIIDFSQYLVPTVITYFLTLILKILLNPIAFVYFTFYFFVLGILNFLVC